MDTPIMIGSLPLAIIVAIIAAIASIIGAGISFVSTMNNTRMAAEKNRELETRKNELAIELETRKNELAIELETRKKAEATWLDSLSPLQVAAKELKEKLDRVPNTVRSEAGIPKQDLKEFYNLRYWFQKCKNYIIVPSEEWPDEKRRNDIAMHSGGMGYDAISTLYNTATYLYYATKVHSRTLYIEPKEKADKLHDYIEAVRSSFGEIGFYLIVQDSIGSSMKSGSGEVMNYREFCEAITNKSQRGWFMTLADVYYKLHTQKPEHVEHILQALDNLIKELERAGSSPN